jgi:hypothetical protein
MLPFALGGPQLDAEPLGEPAGEAHVIGMEMGADEPRHRAAVERRRQQPLPQTLGLLVVDAGIDDRPAGAVVDQPEIDVVEREGQRHAQPAHARRHLGYLTGRRRRRMRKAQRGKAVLGQRHAVPIRSNTAAMPWPTPMHMVASA